MKARKPTVKYQVTVVDSGDSPEEIFADVNGMLRRLFRGRHAPQFQVLENNSDSYCVVVGTRKLNKAELAYATGMTEPEDRFSVVVG